MKREILDAQGNPTGAFLELPDDTPEEIWEEQLARYQYVAPNEIEIRRKNTIIARKEWADELMQKFKDLNIAAGINIGQAIWLQHRMRALEISFHGVPMIVDMLNLVISGDIEVACVVLQLSSVDDMSQPYHWFSEDKRSWLVNEMKKFLGWS